MSPSSAQFTKAAAQAACRDFLVAGHLILQPSLLAKAATPDAASTTSASMSA